MYLSARQALRYALVAALGLHSVPGAAVPIDDAADLLTARASSIETTIAKNGEGDFKNYRIVALANAGNNVILASYDGRPDGGDSPSPNSIMQRRSTDGGKTWGEPTYIAKGQTSGTKYGFSDPSYVVDRDNNKIFNFHTFSKDAGFASSKIGNDDADRNIMSAHISVSTDGGQSWSTDPKNRPNLPPNAEDLITKVVKPVGSTQNGKKNVGGVVGTFATSGEGIQLRYGAHKGRLIQQYIGRVIQEDGSEARQAYSVYSDDGGSTWKMGTPVGSGMDENKVVELSNGDVMLNSRPQSAGYRKVAKSTDGGVTYSEPKDETQLPDPANNGHITRMYPDAAEGSAEAKILLFTNTNSKSSRVDGTVRYSCDDGVKWSAGKKFHSGSTDYTIITALGDDTWGIFYEALGSGQLNFAKVDKDYLGVNC